MHHPTIKLRELKFYLSPQGSHFLPESGKHPVYNGKLQTYLLTILIGYFIFTSLEFKNIYIY